MNAQEWCLEVKKHDGGMVAFCCDQLAAKDDLIVELQEELRLAAAVKLDLAAQRGDLARQLNDTNTVLARQSMKTVNQRNSIDSLQRALAEAREDHVKTLRKLDAAKKAIELRRIKAKEQQDANDQLVSRIRKIQRRLISAANEPFKYPRGFGQLLEELDDQFFGIDFAKGEPWITRAYTTGWGGIGKTAQAGSAQIRPLTRIERRAEARRCRDAGIKPLPGTYGEDDLRELEIFEQVKRETPECNQGEGCPTCNTIAAKRFEELRLAREQQAGSAQTASDWGSGSCGESAAEDEARETESLAHRIEKLENGRRYDNQCAVEKMLDAEKRLGMHDTQFRRTTERFDRHAKKLIELDGEIRHARDSRRKMHAQIGALESRVKEHADSFATRINYVEGTAFERIVDIHKTAEADRVEFRAADAAVHERVAKLAERIGSLEAHRNGRTVG
jgi:chromosome segregation ATPase